MAAIIAGTFTSVRYVLSLTDTITANQQEIVDLTRDLKQAQKNIADQNTRLSSAEATWTMAENLYRGSVDGIIGPKTREGILIYQSRNSLPLTGQIDNALLLKMNIR